MGRRVFILSLVIGAGVVIYFLSASLRYYLRRQVDLDGDKCYYAAQAIVKTHLAGPRTAKFSVPFSDDRAGFCRLSNGVFRTWGYVDSSPMGRQDWKVAVLRTNGGYLFYYVEIGGQTVSGSSNYFTQ